LQAHDWWRLLKGIFNPLQAAIARQRDNVETDRLVGFLT
jgi:hypothetical protein